MLPLIQELWYLKRDLVSDDFDRALYRLADEFASPLPGLEADTFPISQDWRRTPSPLSQDWERGRG